MNRIEELSWQSNLKDEFEKPYFLNLINKIEEDRKSGKVILPCPYNSLVYRAFEITPLWKVKVVILGQDPYPDLKNAMGLSFSVPPYQDAPKSLQNIFKELKNDLGIDNRYNDLSYWAYQGVFLLNTVLTVNNKESGSHRGYGWETFTDEVLKCVCKNQQNMIYLLMGRDAQEKKQLILDNSKDDITIIETAHPSPLSAHRGFFWSKPFSKINNALIKYKKEPINWQL